MVCGASHDLTIYYSMPSYCNSLIFYLSVIKNIILNMNKNIENIVNLITRYNIFEINHGYSTILLN